ncbi:MAG: hypothetical protein ACOX53_08375 [Limnochordia bacterium]
MRRPKLQWKIFLYLLGFCVLLLGFLWMFQTVFLSDMYKFVRKLEIARAISLVEKNIDSPDLESILLELESGERDHGPADTEFCASSASFTARSRGMGPEA